MTICNIVYASFEDKEYSSAHVLYEPSVSKPHKNQGITHVEPLALRVLQVSALLLLKTSAAQFGS